ncbi:hypothetical protein Taro_015641 [Colocasia esculenta]|uniref:Aminotransferase-like plant mobile domain-containing protein n=1 Tax=Colocasia esculenta TaxID=4460 RepID=A0A843UMR6_COLES|nr:hypothetical protein [Colocasia esculenta]
MEGGGDGGGNGDDGRQHTKKTIQRRQVGEGRSGAAHEDPLVVPMEEDTAAVVPGEDEPVGPKKSELRSRLGWAVVWAIYRGLPDFRRARLAEMGFGPFLRLDELASDVALIQALKERWDSECHAFLFPWGHMIPTLEDVAQITGLHVDGQAVTGVTYTSYQELAERLLGLEVTRERSSLAAGEPRGGRCVPLDGRGPGGVYGPADSARAALEEEEGAAADRDLRRFLILVIGKFILGTRGDPVSCRCLPLLEDLSSVGSYAWGAALLAHLFDSLGTSSRETAVAGFFPLLQVWAYYHLPSLGRGRWRFRRDEQSLHLQVTLIHDALDTVPFGHWTPYVGEDDAAQPWVERGRPYFGKDIWLHSFNTVVPLHHRLVARTLGLHQAMVEFPTRQRPWERPGRSFHGIQQLEDCEQRGREVASEAMSDEDYFRAYARRYGAHVYKGSRRPFDPEGCITSLEGILHYTIHQRDDLQAIREELDRAQQMVGGASSSREDPGRSVLEGQLAAAVARAEDTLTQVQEREAELRNALARTATLEAEMVELRLRPEAAEVTRWRQEAEEMTRWRTDVGDLRTQLGEERHHCELLQSEMKGLERALALVGRSRSSVSRSGISSSSAGHYMTGSSGRRRNEEEA